MTYRDDLIRNLCGMFGCLDSGISGCDVSKIIKDEPVMAKRSRVEWVGGMYRLAYWLYFTNDAEEICMGMLRMFSYVDGIVGLKIKGKLSDFANALYEVASIDSVVERACMYFAVVAGYQPFYKYNFEIGWILANYELGKCCSDYEFYVDVVHSDEFMNAYRALREDYEEYLPEFIKECKKIALRIKEED